MALARKEPVGNFKEACMVISSRIMTNRSLCIILLCAAMAVLVYNGSAEPEEARKRDAKSKDKVEVYLAKGEKDAHSSTNVPLSQIELEDVPLFTSDDVLHYDIDSDRFILNDTAYEAIQRVKLSVFGRSFVLMVG